MASNLLSEGLHMNWFAKPETKSSWSWLSPSSWFDQAQPETSSWSAWFYKPQQTQPSFVSACLSPIKTICDYTIKPLYHWTVVPAYHGICWAGSTAAYYAMNYPHHLMYQGHLLKYGTHQHHAVNMNSLKEILELEIHQKSKPITDDFNVFVKDLFESRAVFKLTNQETQLITNLQRENVKLVELDDTQRQRLITLYDRLDEEVSAHKLNTGHVQFISNMYTINMIRIAMSSPTTAPFAKGINSAKKAGIHYYNGQTQLAKETIYNGMKEVAFLTAPAMGLAFAALSAPYTIAGLVAVGVGVHFKLHNKLFDPKKLLLSKRHKRIAQYYQALALGHAIEAEQLARCLLNEHKLDVNNIELLAEVEEAAVHYIKEQLKEFLLQGLKNLLISGKQSNQRHINYFQHNLKTKCNTNAPDVWALSNKFYPDAYISAMGLKAELENESINHIQVFSYLRQIRDISEEAFKLHICDLKNTSPVIELEFELWVCLSSPNQDNEKIIQLMSQMAGTDRDLYNFYRQVIVQRASRWDNVEHPPRAVLVQFEHQRPSIADDETNQSTHQMNPSIRKI